MNLYFAQIRQTMPMSRPITIQEVLDRLDIIIEEAIVNNNRLGLFAYIYRRTTAEIHKELQLGNFEDNKRLEKLDVEFANLYLDAYQNHKNKKKVSKSWELAFTAKGEPLTIVQHIMLGMNAHINLDLGIATSTTMTGNQLPGIENDFHKVNDILFAIVNEMQDRLSRVSRLLFLLDLAGKNSDEKVIDFSMRKAREQSWNSANLLWALEDDQRTEAIKGLDTLVLKLSERIKSPKSKVVGFVLKTISRFEEKDVGKIISRLRED